MGGGGATGAGAGAGASAVRAVGEVAGAPVRGAAALAFLRPRHAVCIEGRAAGDRRPAAQVAERVVANLERAWGGTLKDSGELVVVTQGDPAAEHGVAPVARLVAEELGAPRAVVFLPSSMDPEHYQLADRQGAAAEVAYADLAEILAANSTLARLEGSVDALLREKNARRARERAGPLPNYFRTYAMLQEVTKAGLARTCAGGLTPAHSGDPGSDTVTSFCAAGLALGLYPAPLPFGAPLSAVKEVGDAASRTPGARSS